MVFLYAPLACAHPLYVQKQAKWGAALPLPPPIADNKYYASRARDRTRAPIDVSDRNKDSIYVSNVCGVAQIGCGVDKIRVRRGSQIRVRLNSIGCGIAQIKVLRGSNSSTSPCWKAGPSSNLGSAPQRRPSTERKRWRQQEAVLDELNIQILYVCSLNVK